MGLLDIISTEIDWLFGTEPAPVEPEPVNEEVSVVSVNPLEAARPKTFADFVGNQAAVNTLKAEMAGANRFRDGRMRNSLLYGPPGTGKTTLSEIIAAEQGYELISTTGSAIKSPMDLYKILFRVHLEGLLSGKVFCVFFDEIHDLMRSQGISEGEYLTLFERGVFNCPSLDGKTIEVRDPDGQTLRLGIKSKLVIEAPWVVIGATTEPGLLSPAMRRRFPCKVFMRPYAEDDMYEIIRRYERALHVPLDEDAAKFLASRARANPARAISLLQFCENRCAVEDTMAITRHLAAQEMKAQGIMHNGLTELDVRVLEALASSPLTRAGEPSGLGLATLSGMIGVSTNTISEICEPYLKQLRLMAVTSRRKITPAGIEFLESTICGASGRRGGTSEPPQVATAARRTAANSAFGDRQVREEAL